MKRIAIIGGGISGISLAYFLSQNHVLNDKLSITIFDNKEEPGGCINSINKEGFIVESGPNGVLSSKYDFIKLFHDAGLSDTLLYSSENTKIKYLYRDGELFKAPTNPISALFTNLISFKGKMRILKEPFIKSIGSLENSPSITEFFSSRIGEEATFKLIEPLIGGIYAGDPSRLSVQEVFPTIYSLYREHSSIIKGGLKSKRIRHPRPENNKKGRIVSSKNGMQDLVKSLYLKCSNVKLLNHTNVISIDKKNSRYKVYVDGNNSGDDFDIICFCCNIRDASAIIKSYSRNTSTILETAEFAPIFICGIGYDNTAIKDPLKGFGYLSTPRYNKNDIVIGTLFSSSLFEGRAPHGQSLFTSITCGANHKDAFYMNDEKIVDLAVTSTSKALGIKGDPLNIITSRNEWALPQYNIGYNIIKDEVSRFEETHRGLYFAGNGINGVSVADCVKQSCSIAKKIAMLFG